MLAMVLLYAYCKKIQPNRPLDPLLVQDRFGTHLARGMRGQVFTRRLDPSAAAHIWPGLITLTGRIPPHIRCLPLIVLTLKFIRYLHLDSPVLWMSSVLI
jgi:hypothetical protein